MTGKTSPLMGIITRRVSGDDDRLEIRGLCLTCLQGSREKLDTDKLRIDVAAMQNAASLKFGSRYGLRLIRGFALNTYSISILREDAMNFDIQNKLILNYNDLHEGRILYALRDMKKGRFRNSRVFVRDGVAMYFRQSRFNSLGVTVRDANQYDYPAGRRRIRRAFLRSRLHRNGNGILMYEKNCMRYEESASVLFEKLIDAGYDNIYYVVNFDNPRIELLDEKYKKYLVEKDSDRHLELFFASNTFVATESTEHALQLRIANRRAMEKIHSRNLKYVFLQHGVMYMVSLNSDLRTGFRNDNLRLQRTVVSSELEAKHFTDLADMKREDLYVTGLAKFDQSIRDDDADKIVIMLTWRRWETNQARDNLKATAYYKFIERIYDAIPAELKNKVYILPHPLMADRFRTTAGPGSRVIIGESYDSILKKCSLLITDYSSIAYDAFYRGANVIFCWEELEECMKHYGEESYLMLDRCNAFGDICMTPGEITDAVTANYNTAQKEKYIERYRKIVEFHDGRNSERIIECMKRDKLL